MYICICTSTYYTSQVLYTIYKQKNTSSHRYIAYYVDICTVNKINNNISKTKFDFQIKGTWNVIEYYASSEEVEIYRCMRSTFNLSPDTPEISMDFTYSYADDPDNEMLTGNITWNIPSFELPGHWVHMETPCMACYDKNIMYCIIIVCFKIRASVYNILYIVLHNNSIYTTA